MIIIQNLPREAEKIKRCQPEFLVVLLSLETDLSRIKIRVIFVPNFFAVLNSSNMYEFIQSTKCSIATLKVKSKRHHSQYSHLHVKCNRT